MPSPWLLGVLALWLTLLSLGTLIVRRELLVLSTRVARYGISVSDGPDVGAAIRPQPDVPRSGVFIFIYGDCGSCHDLIAGMAREANWPHVVLIAGDGTVPGSSAELGGRLPGVAAVSGEAAKRVADAWRVNSGPLGLAVQDGVVRAKGYLRHVRDVRLLHAAIGVTLEEVANEPFLSGSSQ